MTNTTALLLMDFQNGIAGRPGTEPAVARAAAAADAARSAGIPVIFVRVAFRDGFPEVADSNLRFSQIRAAASERMHESDDGTQIVTSLHRRDDEPLVTKRRFSAFTGSDLEVLLRGLGVTRLVLAGISTSGVVLSTVRQAADLDYEVTALSDACFDGDAEVHRILIEKILPMQAAVVETDAWVSSLAA